MLRAHTRGVRLRPGSPRLLLMPSCGAGTNCLFFNDVTVCYEPPAWPIPSSKMVLHNPATTSALSLRWQRELRPLPRLGGGGFGSSSGCWGWAWSCCCHRGLLWQGLWAVPLRHLLLGAGVSLWGSAWPPPLLGPWAVGAGSPTHPMDPSLPLLPVLDRGSKQSPAQRSGSTAAAPGPVWAVALGLGVSLGSCCSGQ